MNLIYFLFLPILINALSLSEFICQSANICNRQPTIQEFCDIFDICLNGIHKTPPTPIELLNKKLNMTEICNRGLTLPDIQIIQRDYNVMFAPSPTTPSSVTVTTTSSPISPILITNPPIEPMSPELISVIVISSLLGLGLLIGCGLVIKKKFIK